MNKCFPQPTGVNQCVVLPPVPAFQPVVKWQWTESTIKPQYNQIINMPVVIDLDGNKIPDVVIVTSRNNQGFTQTDKAFVRALDGATGLEKWASTVDAYKEGLNSDPDYTVNPRATPAAADLDGDGTIEIVTARRTGGLIAFNADGSFRWSSKQVGGADYTGSFGSTTIAIADMDNDGHAEVVAGGVILTYDGYLTTNTSIGREYWGANSGSYGAVSIIADVDGNNATTEQFVVTGNRAIRRDGTFLWDQSGSLNDGYAAIADLDKDGVPELVVTYNAAATARIRVQNATTGAVIGSPLVAPGTGKGGPPTIADFDGDTFMEMASANGNKYNVFEFSVTTKQLSVKWSHDTQDLSSNVTGSSVFDFEGDGAAEVIYNDECFSRVFKGTDGTVLLEIPNSTGTIHEYPVIADVNGDNHSEYIVTANDVNHISGGVVCPRLDSLGDAGADASSDGGGDSGLDAGADAGDGGDPGAYRPRHGIFVYGDPQNKWVRTRRLWNQHAYHLTNVNSDGKIPHPEDRSWGPNGLNNYRVSSQGKGVFNAPDLSVDLEVSTATCPSGLTLRARVKNAGSLGVPAGVKVQFYSGTSSSGTLIAEVTTTGALLPGQSEVVSTVYPNPNGSDALSFYVTVDGGSSTSIVEECLEGNNAGSASGIRCPIVL